MKEVLLVGGFHEIIELCESIDFNIIGIYDNTIKESYLGYPIIGSDADAKNLFNVFGHIPIVVTPDDPTLRRKLVNYYCSIGYKLTSVISRKSIISKSSKIEEGVIIQDFCNISANSVIERSVKLNSCANVMHDSVVGRYSTIAPNAVILGRVKIGENCYIGANSTLLPNLTVTDDVTVGAGAVVQPAN